MAAVILDMEVMGVTSMSFFVAADCPCNLCTKQMDNLICGSDETVTQISMKDSVGAIYPILDLAHMNTMGIVRNPRIKDIIDEFASRLPGHLYVLESKMMSAATLSEARPLLVKLKGAAVSCGFVALAKVAAECLSDGTQPCDARMEALREVVRMSIAAWSTLEIGPVVMNDVRLTEK